MQSQEQEGEDGGGRFAAWWCADYQNLGGGGGPGSVNWDGGVSSWHVGADARIGPGLLAGVSRVAVGGSFELPGRGPEPGRRRRRLRAGAGEHPSYLAWSVLPDLDVWGTARPRLGGGFQIVDNQAGAFHTSPARWTRAWWAVSGRPAVARARRR